MKKKLSLIALLILFTFTLTGCLNKNAKTTDDFIKFGEEKNLKVENVIEQFSGSDYIKEVYIAGNDKWQVEFYVLSDIETAKKMFTTNASKFESKKAHVSMESNISLGNYDSYGLTTGGAYMYVARIDNTLIYLDVDDDYKDDIKEFVKEFDY